MSEKMIRDKFVLGLLIYLSIFLVWNSVFGNYATKLLDKLTGGRNFNYTKNWYSASSLCSGSAQSPIDIQIHQAETGSFPTFSRSQYIEKPKAIRVSKGSYNFVVRPVYKEIYPVVTGGPLQEPYRLDHIAFHWGEHDGVGSEHTINGLKYPLEMQAVHYSDNYDSFLDAIEEPGSIAVMSYLFNISTSNEGDLAIDLIQRTFDTLANKKIAEVNIEYPFPISVLLPPIYKRYVTYQGSLTLPPCTENVTWIVNYKARSITPTQIDKFRMLYESTPTLTNNYRPTQFINNRELYVVK